MIFTVSHKIYPFPESSQSMPIFVGDKCNLPTNALRDDSGDHIAFLNGSFCELTAIYWAWKNYRQEEYDLVGFCHYRRYFIEETFVPEIRSLFQNNYKKKKETFDFNSLISERFISAVKKKLQSAAFILPYRHRFNRVSIGITMESHYRKYHRIEDWNLLLNTTLSMYPEYAESFAIMAKRKSMYAYNMFITTRYHFDRYCAWLFPILFKLHDELDAAAYDAYQGRVMGFLSERLLNLYVIHNFKGRVKRMPVVYLTA